MDTPIPTSSEKATNCKITGIDTYRHDDQMRDKNGPAAKQRVTTEPRRTQRGIIPFKTSEGGVMKLRNLLFILVISAAVPIANAQDHWVGTWAAAPQQGRGGPPPAAANAAAGPGGGQRGQGGPGAPPPAPTSFKDQTVRMVVHTSLGGRRARVTLSNSFGNGPLTIGSAHVAVRSKESAIVPGSDRALMFNGKPNVTIAQGAEITSDPVDLEVPQLGDLAISVYIPGDSGQLTMHGTALHTTYIAKGNVTSEPMLNDATTTRSWYWISSVDVMAPAEAGAIVAFGDSITDGATSSNDADR